MTSQADNTSDASNVWRETADASGRAPPMAPPTDEQGAGAPGGARGACHIAIETAMAGHKTGDAWAALVDAFGNLIAFSANDRGHAEHLLQVSFGDMRRSVDEGWNDARIARSQPNKPGVA